MIAHSQGATAFLYALTEDLKYFQDWVDVFIALAPVAKLDNPPSLLATLAGSDLVINAAKQFGIVEMFP